MVRSVENFTLNDFHGKPYSLADFKDKKVVVLAFLGTECPLAKLYGPRLAELDRKYAPQGVQFLGVNANRQDAVTEIAAAARVAGIGFPMLKDLNNKLADRVGATRTPEVFVLDQARVIRYHGRIDDQYGVGYVKKTASEAYLRTSIDELLSGKPVAKSETGVVGCFIGRVRLPDASAKVTYSNQVSRILNKRCVSCHRAGEVAPFAMTNYAEVSGWADSIVEVVQNRRMPPWLADPKYGHFSNDRSMPEAEKEILYQWAAAGAPEGDPKELPPPLKFVDGWQLPKDPDKVYYMSEKPYAVPTDGTIPVSILHRRSRISNRTNGSRRLKPGRATGPSCTTLLSMRLPKGAVANESAPPIPRRCRAGQCGHDLCRPGWPRSCRPGDVPVSRSTTPPTVRRRPTAAS